MTDAEIVAALQEDTLLNRVRKVFVSESARIEKAYMADRETRSSMDILSMEFEAAAKIIATVLDSTP
jgi:hypothetical protein